MVLKVAIGKSAEHGNNSGIFFHKNLHGTCISTYMQTYTCKHAAHLDGDAIEFFILHLGNAFSLNKLHKEHTTLHA